MEDISKNKTLEVLSTCLIRHSASSCKCSDCIYYGKDCINAHEFAHYAVKSFKRMKEVTDGQSKKIKF